MNGVEVTATDTAAHTADTPQLLLEHHLKELRLPTILREYDKVARQCAVEQLDYQRYLLRITELELLDRERANLHAVFDVVNVGMLVIDEDGGTTFIASPASQPRNWVTA